MALSIGPDELSFSSSVIGAPPVTESSPFSNGHLHINSTQRKDEATVRQVEERRVSATLLDTSINLSLKENSTESLLNGVEKLIALTEKIVNETNPVRKSALEDDAQSIFSELNTAYSNAVSNNPAIAQSSTITAIVETGNDIQDPNKTYTTTVRAAPSLSNAGLSSLSFSDPSTTLTQLKDVRSNLRVTIASYESSSQELQTMISQRGSLAITKNELNKNKLTSKPTSIPIDNTLNQSV